MLKRVTSQGKSTYALLVLALGGIGLALFVALSEAAGWPFLARPIEKYLTQTLNRQVSFSTGDFEIRFLGGVNLKIGKLIVAAPQWSKAESMIDAQGIELSFRYADLWAAYKGKTLRVERLLAANLQSHLERRADGRVSWQLREVISTPPRLPLFNYFEVGNGSLKYSDEMLTLGFNATFSAAAKEKVLNVNGSGQYKGLPLRFKLSSSDTLPWEANEIGKPRIGLAIEANIGQAIFKFNGSAPEVTSLNDVSGKYTISGPSLASVGDPVGVTLPSTSAFRASGLLVKSIGDWNVVVSDMHIGSSQLSGAFKFNKALGKNKLSGRLSGSNLKLTDLGPAIGRNVGEIQTKQNKKKKQAGKVLPTRPFDLAALRVMDANVLIDIREVDLNTPLLEPLRPLKAHLQLIAGVLTISSIQANTAKGSIRGNLALDGRTQKALWTAALNWQDIRLEQWLKLARNNGLPPYVSGQLNGNTKLSGEGKSTAEILASLQGSAKAQLKNGSVSHLLIEAAGIDVAQAIGVFMKGDDALLISCAITDLVVEKGIFKPRLMVVDTKDSAVWIDGSLSLATESLDLKAVVAPKDFSPFALRTPVFITGTFSEPKISLDKATLGAKLGGALLLGLINPIAALIPFIDFGDKEGAQTATQGCLTLARKAATQTGVKIKKPR
jgi:AsmA family protein